MAEHARQLTAAHSLQRITTNRGPERLIVDNENANMILDETKNAMSFALALDLDRQPRMNGQGTAVTPVHDRKQARENERMMVLFTAKQWGWKDPSLHCKRRK